MNNLYKTQLCLNKGDAAIIFYQQSFKTPTVTEGNAMR